MSGDGRNFIAFASGRKRSGKSHVLAQLASRFPRRIVYDFVGEFYGRIPDAIETRTLSQTLDALVAVRKNPRWTIVAMVDPRDVPSIIGAIAPVGQIPEGSYSYSVGGIVQECGECDNIAPNNASISPEVIDSLQRGRHFRLSTLFGTQRPRMTHRSVTAMADVLLAFKQKEPRDIAYLGELIRPDAEQLLPTLNEYEYLRWYDSHNILERVAPDGSSVVIPEP